MSGSARGPSRSRCWQRIGDASNHCGVTDARRAALAGLRIDEVGASSGLGRNALGRHRNEHGMLTRAAVNGGTRARVNAIACRMTLAGCAPGRRRRARQRQLASLEPPHLRHPHRCARGIPARQRSVPGTARPESTRRPSVMTRSSRLRPRCGPQPLECCPWSCRSTAEYSLRRNSQMRVPGRTATPAWSSKKSAHQDDVLPYDETLGKT